MDRAHKYLEHVSSETILAQAQLALENTTIFDCHPQAMQALCMCFPPVHLMTDQEMINPEPPPPIKL